MRDFSEYEKKIIKRIVSECYNEGYSISMDIIIQEMEKVDIIAVEWDELYTNAIFYGTGNPKVCAKIFDIVFLLKYLEDNRYIYVHSQIEGFYNLYNKKRFDKQDNLYWSVDNDGKKISVSNSAVTIHTNIGKEIEQCSKGIMYASNSLINLVQNNFKTSEQLKFEIQLNEAKKQTNYSRGALYASLAALVLSLVSTLFTTCTDTKIENKQLNQIIQSIEKQAIPKK